MISGTNAQFMDPASTASHFHLHEGDSVADFGAGPGHYIKILSKAVGATGRVYACEIQKALVDTLGVLAHEENLTNVRPLWCDLEKQKGTKIDNGILDAGILVNTLFQLEHKNLALEEMARVIRRGGKLFVIDWLDSFHGIGPQPQFVVTEAMARKMIEDAGFACERTFPAGDQHYGLACRRL